MTRQCGLEKDDETGMQIGKTVDALWQGEALEELKNYVRLPSKSKDFDADWENNGYLLTAVRNAAAWGRKLFPDAVFEVLTAPGRTPALYFEIPATKSGTDRSVFFYGHLDKQPEAEGWSNGRQPFVPSVEGDRLYGRGAADDGYNFYAAMVAVYALDQASVARARIVGLYETDEECGSRDFDFWMSECKERFGAVELVVVMDCGGPDYEHLWVSSSFRGSVALTLDVKVLEHGVHSGLASGIAPSSFMIARALLDRIENSQTGEMPAEELNTTIPEDRCRQMRLYADIVGKQVFGDLPWANGTHARAENVYDTVLLNTWKPQLCVTGADGIPSVVQAGNVLRASTRLKLSVRLPPTVDADRALKWLTQTLTAEPMFGCQVSIDNAHGESGWNAPQEKPWLKRSITDAAKDVFGNEPAYCGCGASIGILPLFDRFFENPQYLVTGVLGAQSNAHGPDEMLRLDYLKKLTRVVALVVGAV